MLLKASCFLLMPSGLIFAIMCELIEVRKKSLDFRLVMCVIMLFLMICFIKML